MTSSNASKEVSSLLRRVGRRMVASSLSLMLMFSAAAYSAAPGSGGGDGQGSGQGRGSGSGQGNASGAGEAQVRVRGQGGNCKEGLELQYRGKRIWHKSVKQLLTHKRASQNEAIRSGALGLPLEALLEDAPEARVVVVQGCGGRSVRVRANDLLEGDQVMILSPSRRGALKLLQMRGKRKPRMMMNRVSRVVLQDPGEQQRLRTLGEGAATEGQR